MRRSCAAGLGRVWLCLGTHSQWSPIQPYPTSLPHLGFLQLWKGFTSTQPAACCLPRRPSILALRYGASVKVVGPEIDRPFRLSRVHMSVTWRAHDPWVWRLGCDGPRPVPSFAFGSAGAALTEELSFLAPQEGGDKFADVCASVWVVGCASEKEQEQEVSWRHRTITSTRQRSAHRSCSSHRSATSNTA